METHASRQALVDSIIWSEAELISEWIAERASLASGGVYLGEEVISVFEILQEDRHLTVVGGLVGGHSTKASLHALHFGLKLRRELNFDPKRESNQALIRLQAGNVAKQRESGNKQTTSFSAHPGEPISAVATREGVTD